MSEKAFRLDFLIAICALLVSALTAGVLVYQTRVIADQYAATIWPYLGVSSTYSFNGEKIELENEGLGPALIQSAQLSVDGKAVPAWNDYLQALIKEPEIRAALLYAEQSNTGVISTSSIGPSSTIRPGESKLLVALSYKTMIQPQVLQRHPIALDFCYCSLNGSCWTLHATPGQNTPSHAKPISQCTTAASIDSYAMSPSAPPHKK